MCRGKQQYEQCYRRSPLFSVTIPRPNSFIENHRNGLMCSQCFTIPQPSFYVAITLTSREEIPDTPMDIVRDFIEEHQIVYMDLGVVLAPIQPVSEDYYTKPIEPFYSFYQCHVLDLRLQVLRRIITMLKFCLFSDLQLTVQNTDITFPVKYHLDIEAHVFEIQQQPSIIIPSITRKRANALMHAFQSANLYYEFTNLLTTPSCASSIELFCKMEDLQIDIPISCTMFNPKIEIVLNNIIVSVPTVEFQFQTKEGNFSKHHLQCIHFSLDASSPPSSPSSSLITCETVHEQFEKFLIMFLKKQKEITT